MSFFNSFY